MDVASTSENDEIEMFSKHDCIYEAILLVMHAYYLNRWLLVNKMGKFFN